MLRGLVLSGNHARQSLIGDHESGNHRHLRLRGDSLSSIEVCCYDPEYSDKGTSAVLSNGAGGHITYTNFEPGNKDSVYYPVQITDANGNFISINYVLKAGKPQPPRIDTIVDTVGRAVRFYYDAAEHLVTITGPGLDARETEYARFVYLYGRTVDIRTGTACKPFHTTFDHLWGVIFPATSHAFWLPSSSGYGTSTWFWQATGVQFPGHLPFDAQLTVTDQGRESSRSAFDYPSRSANDCITAAPTYSTRQDSWRDDVPGGTTSATTKYARADNPNDSVIVVTNADSSSTRQYVSVDTDEITWRVAGQVSRIENVDGSGVVLSSTDFEWSLVGDAPRQQAIVQNIDPMGRGKRTTFEYDPAFRFLLTTTRFYGYSDGQTAAPLEHSLTTTFVRDADVVAERFLALPLSVVHTSAQSNEQTVRTFEYDKKPLTAVGVIAQHGAAYEPHDSVVCVEWDTSSGRPICVERKSVPQMIVTVRGNLTRLTDFADAASRASPVSTSVEYDSKGNVLKILDDFGSGTEVTYGVEDRCVPAICSPPQGFSLPTAVVSGSLDPSSTLRTTSTFDYYFGPGLPKSVHDEDGRVSSYEYWQGDATWRVSSATAGEKVTGWAYNDDALATTMMVVDSANEIADSAIVQNDGIGRVRRITGNRGGSFKVDTEYNAVGRVVRRSNPYWQDVPIWTTWTFDGLGRPTTIRTPGNPVATYLAYDTLPSPTIAPASPLAGTTVYTTDPWGRKRWTQADSFGNLKYAVETVAPLSIESRLLNKLTQYQYDVFGRLRTITFDKQTRSFDYDGLTRLRLRPTSDTGVLALVGAAV